MCCIRYTKEWVDTAKTIQIEKDEELVSFDVVSLFTSIPTEVAIQGARKRLHCDTSLSSRTALNLEDICELLSFCLSSTQFQFGESFYQQIHGTAMGFSVSVVVANLVMENLENNALQSFNAKPKVYKRFVDDTIAALKTALIDAFNGHLNAQNPRIKFTIERYHPDGLAFLDTLNKVEDNGRIDISAYRKPTQTDRYLQFDSHQPIHHKATVAKSLYSRAAIVSSNSLNKRSEV